MFLSLDLRSWLLLVLVMSGCQTPQRAPTARAPAPQAVAAAGPNSALEINSPPAMNVPRAPDPRPGAMLSQSSPRAVAADPPAASPGQTLLPAEPVTASQQGTPTSQVKQAKPAAMDGQLNTLPPTGSPAKMKELYAKAAAKYATVDSYICRFRRREVVDGRQMPEDRILLKFRKDPFSVYFKWLEGTTCEGREIIYVKGMNDDKLLVKTGRGDSLIPMRVTLDLHSERATSNSRHTMEEAGMGMLIESLGQALAAQETGNLKFGTFQYLGPQQRTESAMAMECLLQQVPPGLEKHLLRGGQRYWFFSTDTRLQECGLPVLVITYDDTRREVEYYFNDRFNMNVVNALDFDPRVIWAKR